MLRFTHHQTTGPLPMKKKTHTSQVTRRGLLKTGAGLALTGVLAPSEALAAQPPVRQSVVPSARAQARHQRHRNRDESGRIAHAAGSGRGVDGGVAAFRQPCGTSGPRRPAHRQAHRRRGGPGDHRCGRVAATGRRRLCHARRPQSHRSTSRYQGNEERGDLAKGASFLLRPSSSSPSAPV